jgi:hypothetical protein
MSKPHVVSNPKTEYEYYRSLQEAEGKLAVMTAAKNKAVGALDQMYVKISTGVSASNAECHRWAQLIAELEKVK